MKQHDAATDLARAASSQSVAWLLRLGPEENPLRAATLALELDAVVWPAIIAAPPAWSMEAPDRAFPAGLGRCHASVILADAPESAPALSARFENEAPGGMAAELSLLWRGPSGAWGEAAPVVMLRGRVARAERLAGRWRLELEDSFAAIAKRNATRLLEAAWVGGADVPHAGETMPLVFGRHARLPLMPLRAGASARLASPLMRGDGVAMLTSVEGFPDAGRAQLGDEVVAYAALDRVAATLGTAAHPLARPAGAPLHSAGEPVRLIPDGGFLWLVADHPCASVGPLMADGIELPPGDWSAELIDLGGVEAQAVRMPFWPTAARFARATRRVGLRELLGVDPYVAVPESTASYPAFAVDAASTSTHAVLSGGAGLLAFDLSPDAARLGPLAGLWSGAALAVRYSASGAWLAGTHPKVRVVRGASAVEIELPAATTDGAARAIRELRLDLAPLFEMADGWGNLAGVPPPRLEIAFHAAGGELESLYIHDLEIEVEHYPRLASEEAREIAARVEGWPGIDGTPKENPVDVLATLAGDARFGGLGEEAFDAASLDAARDGCDARGLVFARVVRGGTLGELIDSAASEAALLIRPGGAQATLAEVKASPWPADTIESLDEHQALDADAGIEIIDGDPAHPASAQLEWLTSANSAPARLARRRDAALHDSTLSYAQVYPPGAALLEPGDTVLMGRGPLGLDEAAHCVRALRLEEPASVRIETRGPQAGGFIWRDPDGHAFVRAMGFGGRILFVIDGRPVASLMREGELCLAGEVREEAEFPESATAPFGFDGEGIVLAAPAGAGFVPFARITPTRLELNRLVRELAGPLDPPTDGKVSLAEGSMTFSSDGVVAAARWNDSDATLRVAGTIRENIEVY